jgi:hypothetical protein
VFFSDAEARGICQPCGHPSRELAVHHLVPVSEGGGNSCGNAMVVCPDCHRALHKGGASVLGHTTSSLVIAFEITAAFAAFPDLVVDVEGNLFDLFSD